MECCEYSTCKVLQQRPLVQYLPARLESPLYLRAPSLTFKCQTRVIVYESEKQTRQLFRQAPGLISNNKQVRNHSVQKMKQPRAFYFHKKFGVCQRLFVNKFCFLINRNALAYSKVGCCFKRKLSGIYLSKMLKI